MAFTYVQVKTGAISHNNSSNNSNNNDNDNINNNKNKSLQKYCSIFGKFTITCSKTVIAIQ